MHPMSRHHTDESRPVRPPTRRGQPDHPDQREPPESRGKLRWRKPTPGVLVIHARGELDSFGAGSLGGLVDEQLGLGRVGRVVVDLTDITMISCEGMEVLLDLHRRSRFDGFALVLVGASRRAVERPLRVAGVLPLFATRPTVRHALTGVPGAL